MQKLQVHKNSTKAQTESLRSISAVPVEEELIGER
jgi:hypothetical protein